MGIMADNAREAREAMEAMAFNSRQNALDFAEVIAKRAPKPIADLAERVLKAKSPKKQRKAAKELEKQLKAAAKTARKAYKRHGGKGDTAFGDFFEPYAKLRNLHALALGIRDSLRQADFQDDLTFKFLLIEKGLSEIGA